MKNGNCTISGADQDIMADTDSTVIGYDDHRHAADGIRCSETITSGVPIDNFVAGVTTYDYGTNLVNQLQSKTNPNQSFAYDNDGNMTTAYTPEGYQMTLGYDAANRLTSTQYTGSANKVYKTTYDYSGDSLLAVVKKFENRSGSGRLDRCKRFLSGKLLSIKLPAHAAI
jgi:YD repeat-containing protein